MTPKPLNVPEPPIQNPSRPIFLVLFGNLACALIHAFSAAPAAGEATRGYLHGGLAMDFIGQKGPTSRVHLVLLDLLIMTLQIFCLGAVAIRNKAKKGAEEQASTQTPSAPAPDMEQTLNHEERGQLASEHRTEDIELRNLNPARGEANAAADGDDETEHTGLLSGEQPAGDNESDDRLRALDTGSAQSSADMHILDAFNSGQAVVASLSLPRVVREQIALAALAEYAAARAGDATSSGISPDAGGAGNGRAGTMGAAFASNGSRLGFRMRFGDRIFGVGV
ncbi:hypothetical protein K461DRAFT_276311 [Myriangium duriaei CBS 260.36]|uniref:DUF1746 domain-containing protein n=1 Tax=Myriangium duriaei CBS 260.36 TaxID=1168546 RepID=A0A9P4J5E6_9PEZI|nr:hypothetical protein K461DRAFT_276311 [Myriangium duriaei CBS 260.36]